MHPVADLTRLELEAAQRVTKIGEVAPLRRRADVVDKSLDLERAAVGAVAPLVVVEVAGTGFEVHGSQRRVRDPGPVSEGDLRARHLPRARDVIDRDVGTTELFGGAVVTDVVDPHRLLDGPVPVGVLVDHDLDHVIVELHRDPIVEVPELAAEIRLDADTGGLGLAHRSDPPRTVTGTLETVRGDVEVLPGDIEGSLPAPDLGVARGVHRDAGTGARQCDRLLQRGGCPGPDQVEGDAPLVGLTGEP